MSEEYVVGADSVGKRIDVFLAQATGITRSAAAKAVADGSLTVDGRCVSKNHKLENRKERVD